MYELLVNIKNVHEHASGYQAENQQPLRFFHVTEKKKKNETKQ